MTEQKAIEILSVEEQFKSRIPHLIPVYDLSIKALEKQIPQQVKNQQGYPTWGYCPSCEKTVTKSDSPVGCKWCLQRLKWEGENEE